jgi:predicted RNase H-like nuclease (RuvC/YqgF family)
MTDEREARGPKPSDQTSDSNNWKLTWRRFFEFGRNILELEHSVASLKTENQELRRELREMQRQLDELSGEVKGLSRFVSNAMDDKIDAKVEKAEVRAFERLLSMVRGSTREIE